MKLKVENRKPLNSEKLVLINEIISASSRLPIYIVGRNALAVSMANKVHIEGFVDDYFEKDMWHEFPVLRTHELPKAIVLNCSTSISPMSVENMLSQHEHLTYFSYADFHQYDKETFPLPEPMLSRHKSFVLDNDKWQKVYNALEDSYSKKLLNDIVSFDASSDYHFLHSYRTLPKQQYFEQFMCYENEVFVDAGGYTGDTTELFCNKYPDYQKVYLFEPSPENMIRAKNNLQPYKHIHLFEAGVSDKAETLYFDPKQGSSCSVKNGSGHNDNNIVIKTVRIDDVCLDDATFIKMDLEGWELKALNGARETIKKRTPKLALSVYHKAEDIWQIFELIMSINDNYKVFLRHYTEGWSETIMYFLPKN